MIALQSALCQIVDRTAAIDYFLTLSIATNVLSDYSGCLGAYRYSPADLGLPILQQDFVIIPVKDTVLYYAVPIRQYLSLALHWRQIEESRIQQQVWDTATIEEWEEIPQLIDYRYLGADNWCSASGIYKGFPPEFYDYITERQYKIITGVIPVI